jgi:transcriptional regulator with GAF, ATPase, and Fis domain
MPLTDSPLLASVIAMKQTSYIARATNEGDPHLPYFMRMPPDHVGIAVPIIVGGEVVGVLYADGHDRRADHAAVWPEQVELLVRHAALRLENVTSVRTVEVLTKQP